MFNLHQSLRSCLSNAAIYVPHACHAVNRMSVASFIKILVCSTIAAGTFTQNKYLIKSPVILVDAIVELASGSSTSASVLVMQFRSTDSGRVTALKVEPNEMINVRCSE